MAGKRGREIAEKNLCIIRQYFQTHLCATARECSAATGIGEMAVGRHVKRLRAEWGASK